MLSGSSFNIRATGEKSSDYGPIIRATTDAAVIISRLVDHPFAPDVLSAFNLTRLIDPNFPSQLLEEIISPKEPVPFPVMLREVWDNWYVFENSITAIEKILIPREVKEEKDFDEVLTVELRYDHDHSPKVETVAEVLKELNQLYATIARAYGNSDFPPLRIIYADSGTSIRFDLSGLGEIIKESKELLVELWNRFRHRKAEDYETNVYAFMGGLKARATIESQRQQGVISDEDAARYTRLIMESGIALFKAGALPREVPKVEEIQNQKILEEVQQRLLPPAPSHEEGKQNQKQGKKSAKKNRARKSAQKAKAD